jgi:hypothetical protein
MDLTPNLWCKFDTGALLTNDGTDDLTLAMYNVVVNANVSVRGNNSASFSANQAISTNITEIQNNSFSISLWVYSKINSTFLTIGNSGGNGNLMWINLNSNKYTFTIAGYYAGASTNTFATDLNNWVHLVFTFNANDLSCNIYRNGIKLDLNSYKSTGQYSGSNFLQVGLLTTVGDFFNGYIDDLRIYKKVVLSQTQINDLYNGNTYYNLPTALTRYNTDPTNTTYQFEVVDEEQKLINRY